MKLTSSCKCWWFCHQLNITSRSHTENLSLWFEADGIASAQLHAWVSVTLYRSNVAVHIFKRPWENLTCPFLVKSCFITYNFKCWGTSWENFLVANNWWCCKMAKVIVILMILKIWLEINLVNIITFVTYCWIYAIIIFKNLKI